MTHYKQSKGNYVPKDYDKPAETEPVVAENSKPTTNSSPSSNQKPSGNNSPSRSKPASTQPSSSSRPSTGSTSKPASTATSSSSGSNIRPRSAVISTAPRTFCSGKLPEWSNGADSKSVEPFGVPGVRIPHFPQLRTCRSMLSHAPVFFEHLR